MSQDKDIAIYSKLRLNREANLISLLHEEVEETATRDTDCSIKLYQILICNLPLPKVTTSVRVSNLRIEFLIIPLILQYKFNIMDA